MASERSAFAQHRPADAQRQRQFALGQQPVAAFNSPDSSLSRKKVKTRAAPPGASSSLIEQCRVRPSLAFGQSVV
jgi:hypothetical protein